MLGLFIVALVLSGVTAFPLQTELNLICSARGLEHAHAQEVHGALDSWLLTVRDGLADSYSKYPWLAYGTDWLAFTHIAIAVFFIGPFINPTRNVWVLQAALIACILVPVLALICGPVRGIPFGWRMIDCSFGVIGVLPSSAVALLFETG